MRLQKKRSVIERTNFSSGSKVSSLMDDLELREMEAYENEVYCGAFILQFSFLELKIEIKSTWKVSDKNQLFGLSSISVDNAGFKKRLWTDNRNASRLQYLSK